MSLNGEPGDQLNLLATMPWKLSVTGTASAVYVDAENSDAAAGSLVIARKSHDRGTNINWRFLVTGTHLRMY